MDGGFPRADCYIGLAGLPSYGKSAMMISLIHNLLKYNGEELMIFFMTIDDAVRQVVPRLLACHSQIPIRKTAAPAGRLSPDEQIKYDRAKDWLEDNIRQGRLIITDQEDGNTLNYALARIRWLKKQYRDKQILFMLDNFHKLVAAGGDRREQVIEHSNGLQYIKTAMEMTVVTTLEVNKASHGEFRTGEFAGRPRLKDLSESGKIEYDANAIFLLYNDLQAKEDRSRNYWTDYDDGEEVHLPYLEANLAKNKVAGAKTRLFFEFNRINNVIRQTTKTQAQAEREEHGNRPGVSNNKSID
jgi:replicative DNA helicase